jgi:hypothetical protein
MSLVLNVDKTSSEVVMQQAFTMLHLCTEEEESLYHLLH